MEAKWHRVKVSGGIGFLGPIPSTEGLGSEVCGGGLGGVEPALLVCICRGDLHSPGEGLDVGNLWPFILPFEE